MNAKRRNRFLGAGLAAVVFGLAGVAGCSSDGSTPLDPITQARPGELMVSVSGGPSPGSAYVLIVSGPGITGAEAIGDAFIYSSQAGRTLKAAILLPGASSGEILEVSVRDLKRVADYSVTLLEVADYFNDALDAASYTVGLSQKRY